MKKYGGEFKKMFDIRYAKSVKKDLNKIDALVKSQFSDGFVKSSQARRAKPEE
jgi:mRNA-degrading endonuclease RelE of RelBE toxin-antitoxin system